MFIYIDIKEKAAKAADVLRRIVALLSEMGIQYEISPQGANFKYYDGAICLMQHGGNLQGLNEPAASSDKPVLVLNVDELDDSTKLEQVVRNFIEHNVSPKYGSGNSSKLSVSINSNCFCNFDSPIGSSVDGKSLAAMEEVSCCYELAEKPYKGYFPLPIVSSRYSFKNAIHSFRVNMRKGDEVSAAVYAPTVVEPDEWLLVQVFLYKLQEYAEMERKARMADNNSEMRSYMPLDLLLKKGTKVDVEFSLPESGIELANNKKSMVWQGHLTECDFKARIPVDIARRQLLGQIVLSINGMPIAEMSFTIAVGSTSTTADINVKKFARVFISYAHEDTAQVKFIAEAYRALGDSMEYFFDRHNLEPGDMYRNKIFEAIDHADLFILCWSKNASASEWVNIERKRALDIVKHNTHQLKIYPISITPQAELPADMKDVYTFGQMVG